MQIHICFLVPDITLPFSKCWKEQPELQHHTDTKQNKKKNHPNGNTGLRSKPAEILTCLLHIPTHPHTFIHTHIHAKLHTYFGDSSQIISTNVHYLAKLTTPLIPRKKELFQVLDFVVLSTAKQPPRCNLSFFASSITRPSCSRHRRHDTQIHTSCRKNLARNHKLSTPRGKPKHAEIQ